MNTDYSLRQNWLSLPEESRHKADVFYFYPTCYVPQPPDYPLISSIDDADMRRGAVVRLKTQAYAFADCADIYAPFYRQCDPWRMAGSSMEEFWQNMELPLQDIFTALDYFFTNVSGDRPYILAGHSQGSIVLLVVLQEYFKRHPELQERMVCAYVIGYGVTPDFLAANPHLRFAAGAEDCGVIVSYNVESPLNEGYVSSVLPKGSIPINPLNWRLDATPASVEENLGSLVRLEDGTYRLGPGLANACINPQRGSVICSNLDNASYASRHTKEFGPGSFHSNEYMLYFKNLADNAALRLETWFASHSGK